MELKREFAFDISEWDESADITESNLMYNLHLWMKQCQDTVLPSSIIIRRGQFRNLSKGNVINSNNFGTRYVSFNKLGLLLRIKIVL